MDPGGRRGTRAGAPSVCVNLSSDHTHDLLLYLGVLSINVGIAHLPILIAAEDDKCEHRGGGTRIMPTRAAGFGGVAIPPQKRKPFLAAVWVEEIQLIWLSLTRHDL